MISFCNLENKGEAFVELFVRNVYSLSEITISQFLFMGQMQLISSGFMWAQKAMIN